MTPIAYTPRIKSSTEQSVLGSTARTYAKAASVEKEPQAIKSTAPIKKKNPDTIEKVVGRIPTLYVILFATVLTSCAVLIIWNTLQVNRLSLEKTKIATEIEQTKQRIIKLKAEEMQLSAPDRIRQVAKTKFGMIESDGVNEIILPSQ